ncbi:MAG: hypothetical protein P1U89_15785 [Verrucomicrobiales bacterium]|nr:hypothetical protein [Verrucomicrobiales bacterium]
MTVYFHNHSRSVARPTASCLPILLLTIILIVFPANDAGAWGSGHDDVMREVIERLPVELRDSFTPEITKEAIHHQSHYPDNFDPFLAADVGENAVARLTEARVTKRYDLHSERGMAMAFIMLVEALKVGDAARTALWISAYSHVIADMAASNHDPLVHTATYAWADWKLKLPGGNGDFSQLRSLLDLAGVAHDPAGGEAAFEKAIDQLHLEDKGEEPRDLLLEIMLYGQSGADFCASRGVGVLEGAVGWVDRKDPAARELLWKNLGELGAWAVVRTVRDVEIALRYAKADRKIELTTEIEAAHRENVARFLAGRKIEDDALFAPLLRDIDSEEGPVTGIVFEPCWAMNGAALGFAGRVQSAAIARTWQQSEKPYATFDLREAIAYGFPSPDKMPQLVVVAPSFHSYHSLKADVFDRHIQDYLAAGGRVLWICGTGQPASGAFASFRSAMKRDDAKSKLPVPDGDFIGAEVHLAGLDQPVSTIAHPATTKAGWHQPFCPWTFKLEGRDDLLPLATLKTEGVSPVVGAIDVAGRRALLPVYSVTPYLFEGEGGPVSPHQPALGSTGAAFLEAALEVLATAP